VIIFILTTAFCMVNGVSLFGKVYSQKILVQLLLINIIYFLKGIIKHID